MLLLIHEKSGFSGHNFVPKSFTGSNYDHVALLLRFGSGDILILEAVGNTGVGFCRWATFCKKGWYKLYDKMVFRHLNLIRSQEMLEKLQQFVLKQQGKKYGANLGKLLKKKSVFQVQQLQANQNQEDDSFFCSQLVAACYKNLNLLPQQPSSCQYWPGSFSDQKNIQLLMGNFEDELLIDFSDYSEGT